MKPIGDEPSGRVIGLTPGLGDSHYPITMRRLLCLFGYHRHGRVREIGRRLYTNCADCKVALVQDHRRIWLTIEDDEREERLRKQRRANRTHHHSH